MLMSQQQINRERVKTTKRINFYYEERKYDTNTQIK